MYAKKPNENVTGRLLAKELNAPEPEVIAVLDELCKYHLIRNLEITDTNGKMHIYSYENSAEWVAFLTFASMLMYTENEARLAVNMRKQSAFSAPIGSKIRLHRGMSARMIMSALTCTSQETNEKNE